MNNWNELQGKGIDNEIALVRMAISAGVKVIHLVANQSSGACRVAQRTRNEFELTSIEKAHAYALYAGAGLVGEPTEGYRPFHKRVEEWQSEDGVLTPFRCPHHTISGFGLDSEALLSHHGVLLLDEVTEFKASVLQGLRPHLQYIKLVIAISHYCPCGKWSDCLNGECSCEDGQNDKYLDLAHSNLRAILGNEHRACCIEFPRKNIN